MQSTTTHRVYRSEGGFCRMSYKVTRVVSEPAKAQLVEDPKIDSLMAMLHRKGQ